MNKMDAGTISGVVEFYKEWFCSIVVVNAFDPQKNFVRIGGTIRRDVDSTATLQPNGSMLTSISFPQNRQEVIRVEKLTQDSRRIVQVIVLEIESPFSCGYIMVDLCHMTL